MSKPSPDAPAPEPGPLEQPARQAVAAVRHLSDRRELQKLLDAEEQTRARKTVLTALRARLADTAPKPRGTNDPPEGLGDDLRLVWIAGRDTLIRDGRWNLLIRQQLDQMVAAFASAAKAREEAQRDPFVEGSQDQLVAHPGFKVAEASENRAFAIAKALVLTPDARARHKLSDGDTTADPLAVLLDG